ncbi:MAG: hypothetical protein DME81_08215, partial [Verrucomicrobia bacterium]
RIEKIVDPFLGRLREMIIATRTDALILGELDFRHNFRTAGAFLEKTVWDIAFLRTFRLDRWFFENCHGNYARAAVAA